MDIDQANPRELAALRAAFAVDDGGEPALGWETVHACEAERGVVPPEPYRTFVAEISDGSFQGPPESGLVGLAEDGMPQPSVPNRGHIWLVTGEGAAPFGAEFGHTTAESGFAGWVAHWAAGKEWFDAA